MLLYFHEYFHDHGHQKQKHIYNTHIQYSKQNNIQQNRIQQRRSLKYHTSIYFIHILQAFGPLYKPYNIHIFDPSNEHVTIRTSITFEYSRLLNTYNTFLF